MKYNNSRYTIYLPIVIAVSIVIGMFLGKILWVKDSGNAHSLFGKNRNKLDVAIDYIATNFVDSIDKKDIIEDAMPALLAKLDPHSAYIPASEFKEVNDPLQGEFEGIGVQFNVKEDTVVVIQVIAGGPSEQVNIKAGDRIVLVNDTCIAGKKITTDKVVHKLKGPRGTKVKLSIARRGVKNLIDFVITRDKIPFYSIDAAFLVDKTTGYIKISRFATTTHDEFFEKAASLKSKGMKKLILDLRGNGGGVLQAATLIANEFLEAGKLILYTKGRYYPREEYTSDENGICKDTKLAILIDEGTASASEILSGAIQDNDRGTIIGRRSFGKGLVMDQKMFADGSALRLTISRYYTPTGRCIQKPYDGDHEKYYREIEDRFVHGEFEKMDSIKFPDSLKFKTPKGKIVYGGGGIMPDIFVPLDTLGYSKFYNEVSNKGLIYDFAFSWADSHRKELSPFKTAESISQYVEQTNLFAQFVTFAVKAGAKNNGKAFPTSDDKITQRIIELIARNILGEEAFYSLWLKSDKTYEKAFKVISTQ